MTRKLVLGVVFLTAAVSAEEQLEAFGQSWLVQAKDDWSYSSENGNPILKLLKMGQPGTPRRPTKFAVADGRSYSKATLEVEMRREGRSLIIVYAYQDANHWNYAHISSDEALKVNVHNGMFHVFGGERVRISSLEGPASLPTQDWIPVKLVFDGARGHCYVEVNGRRNPSLEAYDLSLREGRFGLGSFNETGAFRNLRIREN